MDRDTCGRRSHLPQRGSARHCQGVRGFYGCSRFLFLAVGTPLGSSRLTPLSQASALVCSLHCSAVFAGFQEVQRRRQPMNVQPIFAFRMALIATLLGLLGCSHDGTQSAFNSLAPSRQDAQGMSAGSNARSVVPPFDPASFVPRVDNPYFPLTPGTVYSYV